MRERQRCNGCGTLPEEWDPEHGGSVHAYHAKKSFCVGCQILAPARRELSNADAPDGVSISLIRGH